jgi:deaminated glutathione amidase
MRMKVSLIQTNPQTHRAENLLKAKALMEAAVKTDAPDLIVLPENFKYTGGTPADKLAAAESAPGGGAYEMAQSFAKTHRVFVHAGSLMEKVAGESRIYNATVVFNREGRTLIPMASHRRLACA